jgi:hypothetical protein
LKLSGVVRWMLAGSRQNISVISLLQNGLSERVRNEKAPP